MSRTYKDKHWKLRFPREDDSVVIEYVAEVKVYDYNLRAFTGETRISKARFWIQEPGVKTKKKRRDSDPWHWCQATPSWWTRITMNRPARRKGRIWEQKVLFQDIEDTDPPGVSRKPHVYYF